MIDIHNEARVAWRQVDDATKAEIQRQHLAGAKVDFHYHPVKGWAGVVHGVPIWADLIAYRIRLGTEALPAFMRPADEMDLTALSRPLGLLHAETQAALREWRHGWLWFDGLLWHECLNFGGGGTYRAKPAPAPNLIERQRDFFTFPSDTVIALSAAHALIATMSGGDPDLRKAYEEAIK